MSVRGKWIQFWGRSTCRRGVGLCIALLSCVILWKLPLDGLSRDGQKCLALSAMGIILWALEVFPLGYTALGLLMGYSLAINPSVAGPEVIFGFFTKPMAYMIISGFIIAGAEMCIRDRHKAVRAPGGGGNPDDMAGRPHFLLW